MLLPRVPAGISIHGGEFAEHVRSVPEFELPQESAATSPGVNALVEYRDAAPARRGALMHAALDEFEELPPRERVAEWRLGADSRFAIVFTTFAPRDCSECGGFWFFERDDDIPYCPQCAGIDGTS